MHRGECVTTGGLYGPTHVCVAHLNCTKKVHSIFFDEVWLGGGGGGVWRGGGGVHVSGGRGGGVHVSGGRGLHGVSEGGGVI